MTSIPNPPSAPRLRPPNFSRNSPRKELSVRRSRSRKYSEGTFDFSHSPKRLPRGFRGDLGAGSNWMKFVCKCSSTSMMAACNCEQSVENSLRVRSSRERERERDDVLNSSKILGRTKRTNKNERKNHTRKEGKKRKKHRPAPCCRICSSSSAPKRPSPTRGFSCQIGRLFHSHLTRTRPFSAVQFSSFSPFFLFFEQSSPPVTSRLLCAQLYPSITSLNSAYTTWVH